MTTMNGWILDGILNGMKFTSAFTLGGRWWWMMSFVASSSTHYTSTAAVESSVACCLYPMVVFRAHGKIGDLRGEEGGSRGTAVNGECDG